MTDLTNIESRIDSLATTVEALAHRAPAKSFDSSQDVADLQAELRTLKQQMTSLRHNAAQDAADSAMAAFKREKRDILETIGEMGAHVADDMVRETNAALLRRDNEISRVSNATQKMTAASRQAAQISAEFIASFCATELKD